MNKIHVSRRSLFLCPSKNLIHPTIVKANALLDSSPAGLFFLVAIMPGKLSPGDIVEHRGKKEVDGWKRRGVVMSDFDDNVTRVKWFRDDSRTENWLERAENLKRLEK